MFNWSEFQKFQVNSMKFNCSFRIQIQVYIHNWTYRVQRRVFNWPWARRSSANQTYKKQLRHDNKYLATAKHKGDQCAQIGCQSSNNYRSTSCPCEANRKKWRRALPLFLSRRSCVHTTLSCISSQGSTTHRYNSLRYLEFYNTFGEIKESTTKEAVVETSGWYYSIK